MMTLNLRNYLLLLLATTFVACAPTGETEEGGDTTYEEINHPTEQPTNPGYTETEYEWDGWNRRPVQPTDPSSTTPIKTEKPKLDVVTTEEESDVDEVVKTDTEAYLVECDTTYKSKWRRKRCTKKFLEDYVYANLEYPEADTTIEGTVTIKFLVDENGNLSGAEVVEGLDPLYDKEALRVVKHLIDDKIKWTPAISDSGEPVPSYFVLPIEFKL